MTTKLQLQKEQARILNVNSPSLGYLAGEAVVEAKVIPNPGELWRNGTVGFEGVIQLEKGLSVRAVSEDGPPVDVDISAVPQDTGFGLTISPAENTVNFYERVIYADNRNVTFNFDAFNSDANLNKVLLTLQATLRGGVTRTVTVLGPTSWRINYSEGAPVFGPSEVPVFPVRGSTNGRIIVTQATVQRARADIQALEKLDPSTQFGTLIDKRGWDFSPLSSKEKEKGTHDGVFFDWTRESDGRYAIRITAYDGASPYAATLFHPQLSAYEPPRSENRTGKPDIPLGPTPVGPSNVEFSVGFIKNNTVVDTQTLSLLNTNSSQTLEYKTTQTGIDAIGINTTPDYRLAWIRTIDVPTPRSFQDATTDTYRVAIDAVDGQETTSLKVYALGNAIRVPTIANVAGGRPHQYLAYPANNVRWNGTSFKSVRTRCPIWRIFDVLTSERFGIELPLSRINVQSFLSASRYCNQLINGRPRWSFDGLLQGTQTEIIDTLLRLVDGDLQKDSDGNLAITIERRNAPKWIVTPATVKSGLITVKRAGKPRAPVRCNFLNRLTGEEQITSGLIDSRLVDVVWQDPEVAERWAKWQNLREQRLLDTVEFTMARDAHRMEVGDLVSVYDPETVGLTNAGRVISSGRNSTNNRVWVQLSSLPLDFWRQLVAKAQLVEPSTGIEDTWGYVGIEWVAGPILTIQKPDGGGLTKTIIRRALWLPAGRPEENRVEIASSTPLEEGTPWACNNFEELSPTLWRIRSITENDGYEYDVVATRYIQGQHAFVEQNIPILPAQYRFEQPRGQNLSTFDGFFSDLNERYPKTNVPFADPGVFSDLDSSI